MNYMAATPISGKNLKKSKVKVKFDHFRLLYEKIRFFSLFLFFLSF